MKSYQSIAAIVLSLCAVAISLATTQTKNRRSDGTKQPASLDYVDMIKKIQNDDRQKLKKLEDRVYKLESHQSDAVIDRIDDAIDRAKAAAKLE